MTVAEQEHGRGTDSHREAPEGIIPSLRYLGPGLILSAAIVGSGELIATTVLGAKAGFALLWLILFGCIIKVGVQLEFGRHCITHGITAFPAWNAEANGRARVFGLHWTVYVGFLFIVSNVLGQGGVLGGASQVLQQAAPSISGAVWPWLIAILLALLVFHGRYRPVELISVVLNLGFVITVIYCVVAVSRTDYAFTSAEVASGFAFRIPEGSLLLAVSAFGITGVGAGEIFAYPTWCVEKGYAAWTGPCDETDDWARRARGWIRVMTIDAVVSMMVYTVATVCFYILGAAILSAQPEVSDGNALIGQLSAIVTEILGEGSMGIFLFCAFAVLFSTGFSNCASNSRLWTDLLGVCRLIDPANAVVRRRTVAIFAFALPLAWAALYLLVERPLLLITFMGVANSTFLIVVAYMAIVYRFRQTDPRLAPTRAYDVFLCLSVLAVGSIAARSLYSLASGG